MKARNLVAAGVIVSAALWATADQPLKTTGLTEKVEKRLVQLDVSVEGDREAIRGITAKDLVIYVGEHEIQGLIVDAACGDAPAAPESSTQAEAPAPRASRLPATLTFFYDQPHLTTMGRSRSLETATDLINRLVIDGARASIVSNAKRLETIVPLTEDREKLLAGLERIRNDPSHWDSYAEGERARVLEIVNVFTHTFNPRCPPLIAKAYARDEFLIARRSTERLTITVGALAEVPAPKALVYFGDTLRRFAGLHYLQIFRCSGEKTIKVSGEKTDRDDGKISGGSDVFWEIATAGLVRLRRPNSMRSSPQRSRAAFTSTRFKPRGCLGTRRVGTRSVTSTPRTRWSALRPRPGARRSSAGHRTKSSQTRSSREARADCS